jgi:hypothetical protein
MNHCQRIVICSILFGLFVAGCVPATNTPVVPTTPAATTSLATKPGPTSTLFPTATNSPSPTAIAIPLTPTPTYTRLPPTWTPLPTLAPTEARAFAMNLLIENSGCNLPCWWGFIPGETRWSEAQQFLAQFAHISGGASTDDPSMLYEEAKIPVPKSVFHIPLQQLYHIKDGVIQTMEVSLGRGVSTYRLSSFLNTYGEPAEIKILTYQNANPPGFLPFLITLFYPDKGIYAGFGPEEAEVRGGVVRGCKLDRSANMFGLWSPEQKMTIDEADKEFHSYVADEPFFSLEEAANMDVSTFYETFRKPNSSVCIETPAKLWPER